MDIIKEIKEILALQNPNEKDSRLSLLNDEFEYGEGFDEADIAEGTQLLLAAALQEDNKVVKKKLFRAIDKAVAHHDIRACVDWDRLATALPSLGKWELEYVLDILGISGRARYLPTLEEYTHHADPEIREWAQEAITEIEYQVARATASQRERRLTA
jgi:hypothetical protein